MVVECHNCEVTIEGAQIAEHIVVRSDDPIDTWKYTLLKCPKCSNPILVEQNYVWECNTFEYSYPKQVYPIIDFHINPEIPDRLKEALFESIKCYRTKANTATVIMCRRTIEGFCLLKGIKSKNLAKGIEELKERQIINEQLFEWANELRISGNEAAHNIDSTFTSIDSKDILEFTIAILDYSYSFQEKFNKFKERRNASTNGVRHSHAP